MHRSTSSVTVQGTTMPTIIPMKNGRAVEQSVLPPIGQGLVDLLLISPH
ncbi:hypothetical protein [Porphyromonas sp. HMSC065F10]|nr:hypothetical protein [Porphyromonas sp. HMSC065F10]